MQMFHLHIFPNYRPVNTHVPFWSIICSKQSLNEVADLGLKYDPASYKISDICPRSEARYRQ